jgi:spore maturation protein CgeB
MYHMISSDMKRKVVPAAAQRFLACGTFVLQKRFTRTELLFQDSKHVKYFDDIGRFFELADWYLKHEAERKNSRCRDGKNTQGIQQPEDSKIRY